MTGRRDGRTEPTLGSLDHLDRPDAPPVDDGLPHFAVDGLDRRGSGGPPGAPPPYRPRKRGWLLPLVVLLVIGVITVLYLQQDRLRAMVPTTDLVDVLGRADAALAVGKLEGTDGSSARELFEAARALEPDNDRARDGLRKVGQAEVVRAAAALQAGQVDEAEAATNTARELLGGGSDVDRLSQQIVQARAPQTQTATLVDQAQAAFDAGKLDGPDGAGVLYRKMLDGDPGNAIAARGLDKVGDGLATKARAALAAGDRTTAAALVERIAVLVPSDGDLPSLRAALAETRKQDGQATSGLLQQAGEDLRAGRFTGNGDDNALARFKAVLATDPDNAQAHAGLGQVAQALIVQASAAQDAGDADQAHQLLDQAGALAPKSADLAAARARLDDVRSAAGTGDDTAAASQMAVSPADAARVATLVRKARVAASRGDIMVPPGDSAYDLYRGALAIDGNDADARAGLQALPGIAQQQFELALGNGNLRKANDWLDTLGDLAPGEQSQVDLRRRLASALIDQAQQRGNAGDRDGARQSLDQARRLDADDARLPDAYARLQAGH